ncbi:MAG: hypothetical protein IPK22_11040 [Verrucomicrobiaceae bacterium]|nr:hypothetical protein [Verrucomicrobiaceae bacterium]
MKTRNLICQATRDLSQAMPEKPNACIVTVDVQGLTNHYRAYAKWTVNGKIAARASSRRGRVHAAIRCASKMFGLTDPSITQLEAELVLQRWQTMKRAVLASANGSWS